MSTTCTAIAREPAQLWRVKADNSALEAPLKVDFPDPASECELQRRNMLGAAVRLFLYEPFGTKLDRRDSCAREIPGGLLSVDPQTGGMLARLAPDVHFASLIRAQTARNSTALTRGTRVGLLSA